MQITVLIEPVAGNGYRARGLEPFGLCAEGATREEALARLRDELNHHLRRGAQLVTLEVEASDNPWVEFAGMFKEDPLFDEVTQIMAENRRKDDADPNYL
jgi:hypothetical protein